MGVRRRYQKAAERQLRTITNMQQAYPRDPDKAYRAGLMDGMTAAYIVVMTCSWLGEVWRGEWS